MGLRKYFWKSLLCVYAVFVIYNADAAPIIGPPSVQMASSPNALALVEMPKSNEQQAQFSIVKTLSGNLVDKNINVSFDPHLLDNIEPSTRYFASFMPPHNLAQTERLGAVKNKTVLARIPGANPALFPANEEFKYYFENILKQDSINNQWVFERWKTKNSHQRTFWYAEIIQNSSRLKNLTKIQQEMVIQHFDDDLIDPEIRALAINRTMLESTFTEMQPSIQRQLRAYLSQTLNTQNEVYTQKTAIYWLKDNLSTNDAELMNAYVLTKKIPLVEPALNNLRALGGHYEADAIDTLLKQSNNEDIKRLIKYRPGVKRSKPRKLTGEKKQ